jgi:hypothetical protein
MERCSSFILQKFWICAIHNKNYSSGKEQILHFSPFILSVQATSMHQKLEVMGDSCYEMTKQSGGCCATP